jgi:GPI mannosyltransferase 2
MQWPWLMQSVPIFTIAFGACWRWASWSWRRFLMLALFPDHARRKTCCGSQQQSKRRHTSEAVVDNAVYAFTSAESAAPFVYHLTLMSVASLFFMHVNVATRFLSASPVVYWYSAAHMHSYGKSTWSWVCFAFWAWALGFIGLGCLLFPNFYPWT